MCYKDEVTYIFVPANESRKLLIHSTNDSGVDYKIYKLPFRVLWQYNRLIRLNGVFGIANVKVCYPYFFCIRGSLYVISALKHWLRVSTQM